MAGPDIDKISLRMESIWTDAEKRIMEDVIRRIKQYKKITSTADYQINRLIELGKSTEEIEKIIKEALDATYPQMFELYDEVANWQYVRNKDIYEQVNGEFIPPEDNEWLKQISDAAKEQTEDALKNLAQSYGFTVMMGNERVFTPFAQYYQQYVDSAIMDIISGGFDYNTVIRRVVTQMTNSGLRTVDYASGYSNRTPVAVRCAVLTGVSQITGQVNERNAALLETDYYEVSWHAAARPDHREWQGKVYSRKQLEDVCGLGTGAGLCGWNCRHDYYPFIPGISERLYTDEWLAEQNKKEDQTKEWMGKEYNAYEQTQKQRQMETAMRAQREKVDLLKAAGVDKEEITLARCKYQAQLDEYSRFCKKMGLQEQRERIYMDMRGRIAPSKAQYQKYLADKSEKAVEKKLRDMEKARYSKFSDRFQEYNFGQKDVITYKRLMNNLNKSNIGKETIEYILKHPEIEIQMCYKVDHEAGVNGVQFGDTIRIYASETKTVQRTAEVLIHEITHHKYNIGGSQWSECVCKAQEIKHKKKSDELTGKELKGIIKEIKELYPDYPWR